MLCHFLLMERSVRFWKAKEGKNDVAEEGHTCQKASLQHCSTNIINVKTALMNLDYPFLAPGAANVMNDMTPEHEAWLCNATQNDIQLPLAGDGGSNTVAEPPQALLSQLSSRAEAPAPEGQLWHTRASSPMWGASSWYLSFLAISQHRWDELLSTVSWPQPSAEGPWSPLATL